MVNFIQQIVEQQQQQQQRTQRTLWTSVRWCTNYSIFNINKTYFCCCTIESIELNYITNWVSANDNAHKMYRLLEIWNAKIGSEGGKNRQQAKILVFWLPTFISNWDIKLDSVHKYSFFISHWMRYREYTNVLSKYHRNSVFLSLCMHFMSGKKKGRRRKWIWMLFRVENRVLESYKAKEYEFTLFKTIKRYWPRCLFSQVDLSIYKVIRFITQKTQTQTHHSHCVQCIFTAEMSL